jgi:hypothetical protein
MEGIPRATGPDGEVQEWTLFAVAFEGLVLQFFAFDPDWEPDRQVIALPDGAAGA